MFFREFPTVSLLPVRHHDACELWGKIDVSNRQAPPALYDGTAGRASVAYSGTYLATAAHQGGPESMDGDVGIDVLHGVEHLRPMDREQPFVRFLLAEPRQDVHRQTGKGDDEHILIIVPPGLLVAP